MLTVYGRKSSANVQKVHWLCMEANLKFKQVNIGGKYGGHTSPEFKNINPNSTIPVLNDENFIVYESNAIIKYISEKFNIFKYNSIEKTALTNQWIDWSSLVFGLQCATYTAHKMLLPIEKRNPSLADDTKQNIYLSFEILNDQLIKQHFILGEELGLADIPIGCWVHRCVILDIKLSKFKFLEKWYNKLKERSAFNIAVYSAPLPPN